MNVDDAMEAAKAYLANEQEQEPLFHSEQVAITLAAEVERLRAELAETKAENVGLEEGHDRLAAEVERLREALFEMQQAAIRLVGHIDEAKAELTEAKAASVPPVKFFWCYESNECDILIHGMNDKDSTRFGNWLDDRMKDKSPPQA